MKSAVAFTTTIGYLEGLKLTHIIVPASVVKKIGGLSKQRLLCTVNKTLTWQCGLVALAGGRAYIALNKKLLSQLKVKIGDSISASLAMDKSKYGMEMPDELRELLDQDKEGSKRFHGIAPGKQRYIIYFIKQVKSSQLRIDRALMIIENIKKLPKGKETFKAMLAKPIR